MRYGQKKKYDTAKQRAFGYSVKNTQSNKFLGMDGDDKEESFDGDAVDSYSKMHGRIDSSKLKKKANAQIAYIQNQMDTRDEAESENLDQYDRGLRYVRSNKKLKKFKA